MNYFSPLIKKDYEKIKNDPNLTVIGHITKKSQGINLIGNGNTLLHYRHRDGTILTNKFLDRIVGLI